MSRRMVSERASERTFLASRRCSSPFSAAWTIVWCASMAAMGDMPTRRLDDVDGVDADARTDLAGAAASFLGRWVVMMVAMMLPSLVPMLWRYRLAVARYSQVCITHVRSCEYEAVNLYVALLRGINVGGSNLIRMAALKACFEAQGFGSVTTYIQSGNVLFTAGRASQHALTARIERALSKTFAYQSRVVVRSLEQMKSAVENAPTGFGRQPSVYRYDVIFLKEPLTVAEALKSVSARPGVDRVFAGDGVLYFSRLISKAAQSHLSRVVATPAYRHMTIRSWNTTARLLELMNRIHGGGTVRGSRRGQGRG